MRTASHGGNPALQFIRIASALLAAAPLLSLPQWAGAETRVTQTEVIGPFTGHDAKLNPDNLGPPRLQYYGTDLGFTYEHRGQIVFLFGDTWATEAYSPIQASTGSKFDDGWGTIEIKAWPDPSKISASHIPTVKLARNPGTDEMAAMNPGHVMDLSKTPLHGFSNGTDEFAIFLTAKPRGCAVDSDCGTELRCDSDLGYVGVPYTEQANATAACIDGTPGCKADTMFDKAGKPVAHSGLCVDPTSHEAPISGAVRLSSVAMKLLIGVRSHSDPRVYENTREWLTNKFFNATARTVQRFTPKASGSPDADYRTAQATGDARRAFVWGRPGFVGVKANQRPLNLYFGYVDLPASREFKWQMHYFTGLKNGEPQFGLNERDAVSLDLQETHDVVNQMSMSWIGPLKKWVMFYGGGSSDIPRPPLVDCGILELFAGSDCKSANMENGAVRMRSADNPWGPWSAAQDVIVGGDGAVANEQHGPKGVLYQPNCKDATCATPTRSPFYLSNEYGFFYAANIIESWTRPAGGGVDVLWNASTWDPYRVVLLRSRIMP